MDKYSLTKIKILNVVYWSMFRPNGRKKSNTLSCHLDLVKPMVSMGVFVPVLRALGLESQDDFGVGPGCSYILSNAIGGIIHGGCVMGKNLVPVKLGFRLPAGHLAPKVAKVPVNDKRF
jgi:hypothetical protein